MNNTEIKKIMEETIEYYEKTASIEAEKGNYINKKREIYRALCSIFPSYVVAQGEGIPHRNGYRNIIWQVYKNLNKPNEEFAEVWSWEYQEIYDSEWCHIMY